jgi:hypothetical protein
MLCCNSRCRALRCQAARSSASKTHQERKDWEAAVVEYIETGADKEKDRQGYWFKYVGEGVGVEEQIVGQMMRRM